MIEWTREEFQRFLQSQSTGLAYFYVPLCGTCQVASRMLVITNELVPDVMIGKIDLNYIPEMAEKLKVMSVPCLLFIHTGKVVDQLYAFQSVPYLLEKIKEFTKKTD